MAKALLPQRVRFVGEPTSADTGYGRLSIHLLKEPINGKWTVITAQNETVDSPIWVRQSVVVSKTVDRDGNLLDGNPVKIDRFVPTTLGNRERWLSDALAEALQ